MKCLHKLVVSAIIFFIQTALVLGEGTCDNKVDKNKSDEALRHKLYAIASILIAGAIGVSLPLLARKIEALRPENNIFFMIKAFAAGVILATGFLHILPDAFQTLTSPCLDPHPWGDFPFSGFIAMMAAIGALMVDTFATTIYEKMHFKQKQVNADEEGGVGVGHVHTHASHGHAHGAVIVSNNKESTDLMRQRVISQIFKNKLRRLLTYSNLQTLKHSTIKFKNKPQRPLTYSNLQAVDYQVQEQAAKALDLFESSNFQAFDNQVQDQSPKTVDLFESLNLEAFDNQVQEQAKALDLSFTTGSSKNNSMSSKLKPLQNHSMIDNQVNESSK